MNSWLQDNQNKEIFVQLCKQTLSVHAPEELPLFEELYPQYIALAAEGDVETGTTSDSPFSFSGDGELVVLVLLPMAVLLFGSLVVHLGLTRLDEIRHLSDKDTENSGKV